MCFLVPLTQAIATTVYRVCTKQTDTFVGRNLKTLELMLWGGTIMLLVDHIINGAVTWMYPFFTALETEGGWQTMLQEMLTVGVPMSVIVTVAWVVWAYAKERKTVNA